MDFQPWENIESMLKLSMALTYGLDPKVVMYSLWTELILIEVGDNKYSQQKPYDISWFEIACLLRWSQGHVIKKIGHSNSLSGIWHMFFVS